MVYYGQKLGDLFNFLFCAGFTRSLVFPESVRPLSRRQVAALKHLWQVAAEFLAVSGIPFQLADQRSDLATRRVSYSGDFVCTREQIVCSLVEPMWPAIGEAAVRPIIQHIEPHLAVEISCP